MYLVLVHDLANDGSGGIIRMILDSPDLVGTNADVESFDDPRNTKRVGTACDNHWPSNGGDDCAAYDPSTGRGSFAWNWVGC